jgi:adenylate cyclase
MSNDPEQEFFSDGITEDIITDLSKASGLFVLGRNTVFTYKGRAVNLEQAARELGVAYLLEGSVRKAGNRVRITAQLIDGATGGHLWAERYDGDLSDIFALQDQIALKIVSALKVKLLPEETRAIKAVPTKNVDAYTYYLRGRELLNIHLTRYYPLARSMFAKAAELDPAFAGAYAGMADCDSYTFLLRNDEAAIASIMDNSARAITLDPSLAEAHASRGLAFWLGEQPEKAEAEYRKALEIDPNLYEANYFFARFCRARGRHEEAAQLFERAAEVRPADYQSLFLLTGEFFTLGRQDAGERAARRALERAERELASRPEAATAAILSATVLAYLGQADKAREYIGLALRAEPDDLRILYNAACAHSQLGDLDRALDLLEKVVPLVPPADRAYTKEDPDFIPLHGHPRFERLLDDARDTAADLDAR